MARILLIEPYYRASHKQWCDGLIKYSGHNIDLLTLPGANWKWRMHGGAITLSNRFNSLNTTFDSIICTDMMDVALFKSLIDIPSSTRLIVYFHESQFDYPWSSQGDDLKKGRDNHYKFINYTSALVADHLLFNSDFHRSSFLKALPSFLKQFPDFKNLNTIPAIKDKAKTIHLGLDLSEMDNVPNKKFNIPVLLWNHRWEHDKNPLEFLDTCIKLSNENFSFGLILLGELPKILHPSIATKIDLLSKHIIHNGFTINKEEYYRLIKSTDILPVTSNHDFFGSSVVEAVYAGVTPLCPNRLAYPEYLPEECLYTGELYEPLKMLLPTIKLKAKNYSSFVTQFNWENIIDKYDKIIC